MRLSGWVWSAMGDMNEICTLEDLSNNKGITNIMWNCRSLYGKFAEIIHIVDASKADLAIFVESWLTNSVNNTMVELEGYNIIRQDRNLNSNKTRGGGIIIYYRDQLQISQRTELWLCTPDLELLVMRLHLTNVREIFYLVVYRPPSGNVKNFVNAIENCITKLSNKTNIEINLVGDININFNKPRDRDVKLYKDMLRRHQLCNLIKMNTCHSHHGAASAVDHFCTNNIELYSVHGVCLHDVSDHDIIFASCKKFKIKRGVTKLKARKYSRLNEELFAREIEQFDWNVVYHCTDVDAAWDTFVRIFNTILDRHAPWRLMKFTDNIPEWCTKEFLSLCKDRDYVKARYDKFKSPIDEELARRKRNQTVNMGKELKCNYFKAALDNVGNDSKKLWKIIKQLLGTKKGKNKIQELNGKSDPSEMADILNDYFTDIGPNLAAEMPASLLDIDYTFTGNREKFNFKNTTVEEVKKLILNISNNKSTGIDGVPIRFLKMTIDTSSQILCFIINMSMETKTVPKGWKTCVLTPLFKDGDRTDPCNYRPIAILPAASKLLERTVHQQVYDYLEENKILSEAQFGFRKRHSTTTCILNLLNDIYLNMDIGWYTGVVFLDLKKAFDTVNHTVLLRKLGMYGFSDESCQWFANYLGNRLQFAKVNGKISGGRTTLCGVPQGSILGPLLFIIYINDLYKYITDCKLNLYADDTALYTSNHSYIDLILSLRIEMATLSQWMLANKLTLNVKKTKFVIFGTKPKLLKIPERRMTLEINNQEVEQVKSFKYLGFLLDESLNYQEHIDYVYTKSCQKLGAIRKCRNCLSNKLTLMLYKSLVAPLIDYCDIVYSNANKTDIAKLQLVQNTACQIILKAGARDHIDDMHRELKLDLLADRRRYHLLAECHKSIHADSHTPLKRFFKLNIQNPNRRTRRLCKFNVLVPRVRTSAGQKAISFIGPSTWNKLCTNLKAIVKLNSFKRELKRQTSSLDNHPT